MTIIDTPLDGVKILQPTLHGDNRGYLFESFRDDEFRVKVKDITFDREYQYSVDKSNCPLKCVADDNTDYLISVVMGSICIEIQPSSGEKQKLILTPEDHRQLFIPSGYDFTIDAEMPSIVQVKSRTK